MENPCSKSVEAVFCCRTNDELSRGVGMDNVGFEAAIDDLTLDDVAWLSLLA
jgi:hypothetical protein